MSVLLFNQQQIIVNHENHIDPLVHLAFKQIVNRFLPYIRLHPVGLDLIFGNLSLEPAWRQWDSVLSDCPGFVAIQPNHIHHMGFSPSQWIIRKETPLGLNARQLSEAIFRLKHDKFDQQLALVDLKLYIEEGTQYLIFVVEFGYEELDDESEEEEGYETESEEEQDYENESDNPAE